MTWISAFSAVLAAALLTAGCGESEQRGGDGRNRTDDAHVAQMATAEPRRAGPSNVVLVSVDTLRADHLGCAGYSPETTPNVDAFSRESVLFRTVVAQAPSTLPSHASMLSSLLPSQHGAFFTRSHRLPDAVMTLAEVLAEAGWRTAAVVGGGQMAPEYGLDQGFDWYRVTPGDARFSAAVDVGLQWLDGLDGEPFFLFLHTYEVHHPYTPKPELLEIFDAGYDGPLPPHISKELLQRINAVPLAYDVEPLAIDAADLAHIVAAYDAEIRSVDAAFAELLAALSERGILDDTMVIFTSDHGEEFGEHGAVGWHSHSLFEELLRVPLIIRLPGARHAGTRVDELVRSIDIAPTVLGELGLVSPEEFVGRSLVPVLESPGSWRERPAVSRQDTLPAVDFATIRSTKYKLYPNGLYRHAEAYSQSCVVRQWLARADIKLRPDLLYDLSADPGETRELAAMRYRRTIRELRGELDRAVASRPPAEGVKVLANEQTEEQLRALGYLH